MSAKKKGDSFRFAFFSLYLLSSVSSYLSLSSISLFFTLVLSRHGCHGEKKGKSQSASVSISHSSYIETQVHCHWQFNHQLHGGLHAKQKKRKDASGREKREHFDLQEMPVQNDREYAFFSINDKSINNLPLFHLNVNVCVLLAASAPFQCTRRSQTPKMTVLSLETH